MQRSPIMIDHRILRDIRGRALAAPVATLNSQLSAPSLQRQAFTLIELAIVIGIMALLVTMLVIAIGPALSGGRVAAVKSTMLRIDQVIQTRVKEINDLDVNTEAKTLAALNTGLTQQEAAFIIRKVLYRQALPQRKEDVWGFDQQNDSGADDDAPYTAGVGWIATAPANDPALSSALLHLALVDGSSVRAFPGGKSYPLSVLSEEGLKSQHHREVSTLGADVEAFYDDWDQPLRFYNFPTTLVSLANSSDAATKAKVRNLLPGMPATPGGDPLDPTGLLVLDFNPLLPPPPLPNVNLSFDPLNAANVVSLVVPFRESFHPVGQYYFPLLVSSGPDQDLGIGEPNSATAVDRLGSVANPAPDSLDDNITSLMSRQK